jgi:RimJ/RimL family protein N-acetyltransferase
MQTRGYTLKSGKVLIIRDATPDDASSVITFVEALSGQTDYLSFGPGEFGYSEAQERAFIRNSEISINALFLLAFIEDALVGILTFIGGERPRVQHIGELGLMVPKAHWGNGIGSLLLDTLIRWAEEGGIVTKLNLRVRTTNVRAIALYERKGFVIEGTVTRSMRIGDKYFDSHLMGRKID